MPLTLSSSHLIAPRALVLAVAGLATAMFASLAFALAPAPASASGTSCVILTQTPKSCVSVVGSSTWVETVGSAVRLGSRQSVHGYHVISVDGQIHRSSARTYWNQSHWHDQTYWFDVAIRRELRDGARVCAQFVELRGGQWVPLKAACMTIRR